MSCQKKKKGILERGGFVVGQGYRIGHVLLLDPPPFLPSLPFLHLISAPVPSVPSLPLPLPFPTLPFLSLRFPSLPSPFPFLLVLLRIPSANIYRYPLSPTLW